MPGAGLSPGPQGKGGPHHQDRDHHDHAGGHRVAESCHRGEADEIKRKVKVKTSLSHCFCRAQVTEETTVGADGSECLLQCAETCAARGSKETNEEKTKHADNEDIEQYQTVPEIFTKSVEGAGVPLSESYPEVTGSLPVEVQTEKVTRMSKEQIPEGMKPDEVSDDIVVELLGLPDELPVEIPDGLLPSCNHQTGAQTTSGNKGIGGNVLDMDPSGEMIRLKDLNRKPKLKENNPPMEDDHYKQEKEHMLNTDAPLLEHPLATGGAACCLTRSVSCTHYCTHNCTLHA